MFIRGVFLLGVTVVMDLLVLHEGFSPLKCKRTREPLLLE